MQSKLVIASLAAMAHQVRAATTQASA